MLGNDIIDLAQAKLESNWRRKGYLDKIFSSQEQSLIAAAKDQDQMVWLLWSMKEATYKIVSPLIGERFYNPKAFECQVDLSFEHINGKVFFGGETFFTESKITAEMIYTTAVSALNHELKHYHLPNKKNYLDDFNKIKRKFKLLKNEENLPTIENLDTNEFYPASVTHHGRFLAIVHPEEGVAC